jgi:hypothetical protein
MMRHRTNRIARTLRAADFPVAISLRTHADDPDLILISSRVAVEVFGDLGSRVSFIHESRDGFRARLVNQDDVLTLVREAMAEDVA